jgi:DNA-binding beta-propeller fold protein YncE
MATVNQKKISLSAFINVVLVVVLLVIISFGYFYLTRQNPAEVISKTLPQVAAPQGTFLYSIYGTEANPVAAPSFVTVFQNEIYVSDMGDGLVKIFDYNGRYLRQIGKGKLKTPRSIAFYNNEIYVLDVDNNKIMIFGMDGKYLRDFPRFVRPSELVIKGDTFYILDVAAHCVIISDNKGNVKKTFGSKGSKPGQLYYPNGILVDTSNQIWVADTNNNRVQVFDQNGKLVKAYSQEQGNYFAPRGMSLDSRGYLYTANAVGNRVTIQDSTGKLVSELSTVENEKDKVKIPFGVFIDQNRRLYVAERAGNRVSVFSIK